MGHVEEHRPTATFLVPAMAKLIVSHARFAEADLSSLTLCAIGSAPLPYETLRAVQEKLPDALVTNGYGMTEAGAAYCMLPPGEALRRPGSVGQPVPPTEVRVVDADDADVAVGEEGQVLLRVRGRRPREYYRDPEATAGAWTDDGWLHTGDVGRLDADGYLYIVGREKDVIIRGGNNVHATDVEEVLHQHPGVLDAAVVAVAHDVLGEDVAAVVVPRDGHQLDPDEVASFCRERLADYKAPRRVEVRDDLPRNATGKVLKRVLSAELDAGRSSPQGG
jgi:acyl-CoA synthetase (AMP-forming)/AMP-acid ligase II